MLPRPSVPRFLAGIGLVGLYAGGFGIRRYLRRREQARFDAILNPFLVDEVEPQQSAVSSTNAIGPATSLSRDAGLLSISLPQEQKG